MGTIATAANAAGPRLETLTDWRHASPADREAGLQACLDRIRTMDADLHAWVQVAPQPATGSGPLDGVPFAVKDIIETRGLATEYGSPIYKGRIGTEDAAIVRDLRQQGGILLGKTQLAAFAYKTPAPTRNPRDRARTPGGSSSGSAAAVAAGMAPIALGTQTKGSVLRPASYCGVTGFKPTFGVVPLDGVLPLARSLDTLGFFTHTPADMLILWAVGHPPGSPEDVPFAAPDPLPDVDQEMAAAFQRAIAALRKAGAPVRPIDIAKLLVELDDAANTVMFYEGARFHEARFKEFGARLDDLADLVRDGLRIPDAKYESALRVIAEGRARVAEIYRETPIVLVPAATGPAPLGLASTGDARMNSPWTALGTPAISIPMPVGRGLPLGLQLTADRGQDARLLRAAMRVERILGGGA